MGRTPGSSSVSKPVKDVPRLITCPVPEANSPCDT